MQEKREKKIRTTRNKEGSRIIIVKPVLLLLVPTQTRKLQQEKRKEFKSFGQPLLELLDHLEL